jgi:hypothetical protein
LQGDDISDDKCDEDSILHALISPERIKLHQMEITSNQQRRKKVHEFGESSFKPKFNQIDNFTSHVSNRPNVVFDDDLG